MAASALLALGAATGGGRLAPPGPQASTMSSAPRSAPARSPESVGIIALPVRLGRIRNWRNRPQLYTANRGNNAVSTVYNTISTCLTTLALPGAFLPPEFARAHG